MGSPVEHAMRVWEAFERGGVERLRPLVSEDVEWRPWSGGGEPVRGVEALAAWLAVRRASVNVAVHGWESHGSVALAHGSLRLFRDGGFVDLQPCWTFEFDGDRLVRALTHGSRAAALATIAAVAVF